MGGMGEIPVVDMAAGVGAAAEEIGRACREHGFFYVVGHGVDEALQARLEEHSREFFAQDLDTKLRIAMTRGGRAWRGYFPPEGELTSGVPDLKEGLYFGAELPAGDPRPLHGPNLFPEHPAGLRPAVLEYLDAMTRLGHTLMAGIALSLDLPERYFAERYTADPLVLFRVFNYPGRTAAGAWGSTPTTAC
jgi:isopenicillin N synthase-like dioxygenase